MQSEDHALFWKTFIQFGTLPKVFQDLEERLLIPSFEFI